MLFSILNLYYSKLKAFTSMLFSRPTRLEQHNTKTLNKPALWHMPLVQNPGGKKQAYIYVFKVSMIDIAHSSLG